VREQGAYVLTKDGRSWFEGELAAAADADRVAPAAGGPVDEAGMPVVTPHHRTSWLSQSWLLRLWLMTVVAALIAIVYFKFNPRALANSRFGGKKSPLLPTSVVRKNID
jgi:hypothetical protein